MSTLYIIGNGFDLWHKLPTSYSDFYNFAKDTLDKLENYYSFDLNEHQPWHNFETALGAFDADSFFDFHNEVDITSDDFRPRDVYGLEDELTEQTDIHVSIIREAFNEWISSIDISEASRKMEFAPNSKFITFNYTSTLQTIYGIEQARVFHIHGRADTHDELIFGHGRTIFETPEFDEDGESTRHIFSDAEGAAMYPLYALKKPVDDVLSKNESYFEKLADINEVFIIGHSLNSIDRPYFQRINKFAKAAEWTICCYSEAERQSLVQRLIDSGVNQKQIKTIMYEELQSHPSHTLSAVFSVSTT